MVGPTAPQGQNSCPAISATSASSIARDFSGTTYPDDNYRSGNTPALIVPKEFSLGLGFAPGIVSYWNEKAGLEGKQLDWGAWDMMVRKSDLEAIWKEAKEERWQDQKEWQKYWEEIAALPDGEMYVLVVAENP